MTAALRGLFDDFRAEQRFEELGRLLHLEALANHIDEMALNAKSAKTRAEFV